MSEGNEVQGRRRMLVVAVKDELLRDALVAALEGNGLAVEGMTQQRRWTTSWLRPTSICS